MSDTQVLAANAEIEEVFAWRMQSFLDMGFTADDAEILACCARIDLNDARKLIARGCPPELALSILY